MKKMIFALITMLTMSASANAMSYEQARNEALFLTDKMAYELNLTDAQYEAAYEINLDYLMGVTSPDDVYGLYWERRNLDLSYILYSWQWDLFRAATYFYRPLYWSGGFWHFGVYARYPHRDYFYFGRPHFYATYRGGHSWRLNGGHSYYEGRHDHFRPRLAEGRSHFGMRDGFNRGDFRGSRSGSSTRITGNRGNVNGGSDRRQNDSRFGNDNRRNSRNDDTYGRGNMDRNNRNIENGRRSSSGNFSGNRSSSGSLNESRSSGTVNGNSSVRSDRPSSSNFSGNRPSSSVNGNSSVRSDRPSSGSFSGNRQSGSVSSSRQSSGSFSGSRSSGSAPTRSSGSIGGASRGGGSIGGASRGGGSSHSSGRGGRR